MTRSDQTRPDQTRPDQTRPDQTRPDQTRPDQTRPDQNYGLSLLKIWMSFEVVLAHFWHSDKESGLLLFPFRVSTGWAVPVFMFVAFLFAGKYIISRNKQKISSRLSRLFIMQFSWAVIYTAFFVCIAVFMNKGIFAGSSFAHVLKMFAGQVILGHTVNATMWFQADLIFITAMLATIYLKFSDKTALILTWLCVIIAFALQYSGINLMMFGELNPYLKYTPGRFCEMIPTACAGLLFVKYGLTEKLQARRKNVILACAVIVVAVFILKKVTGSLIPKGFGYSGIYRNIYAIFLSVIFMLLPMKDIPVPIKHIIGQISRFTPGVYCMHRLIALCLRLVSGYELDSFGGCVVIYAVCIAVSFLISLVVRNGSKYLVG